MKFFFLVLTLLVCDFTSFAQSQDGFSNEEYNVWAEMFCSTDSYLTDVNLKVILTDTIPMRMSLEKDRSFVPKIREYYSTAKLADVATDLILDFNTKNDKSYQLERKPADCKNYLLIERTEITQLFKNSKDGWKEFNLKYPKAYGYQRFSRIGLSPDKKQAVIYLQYSCGQLCGSGDFYFFVKGRDGWTEKVKQNVWIS